MIFKKNVSYKTPVKEAIQRNLLTPPNQGLKTNASRKTQLENLRALLMDKTGVADKNANRIKVAAELEALKGAFAENQKLAFEAEALSLSASERLKEQSGEHQELVKEKAGQILAARFKAIIATKKLKNAEEQSKNNIATLKEAQSVLMEELRAQLASETQRATLLVDSLKNAEASYEKNLKDLTQTNAQYKNTIDSLQLDNVRKANEFSILKAESETTKARVFALELELRSESAQRKQVEGSLLAAENKIAALSKKIKHQRSENQSLERDYLTLYSFVLYTITWITEKTEKGPDEQLRQKFNEVLASAESRNDSNTLSVVPEGSDEESEEGPSNLISNLTPEIKTRNEIYSESSANEIDPEELDALMLSATPNRPDKKKTGTGKNKK